tara:strand:+ start:66 stop:593 length:528 start_codon:yes stop_codon:yes gene_type:complete
MAIEITDEEINEILNTFEEELEENDRSLIRLIALGIAFDIAVFTTRIERLATTLRGTGVSQEAIFGILASDLATHGAIFGELRNSIVRGIVFGNNQFSRTGQVEVYGDSIELFRWVTIQGHRICDDCQGREGEIDTLDGWMSRGMPGSGWSLCGGYCYCALVPVESNISDVIEVT